MESTPIAEKVDRTGKQCIISVDKTQDLISGAVELALDHQMQFRSKKIRKTMDWKHPIKKLKERLAKLEAEVKRMREEKAIFEALLRDKRISASKVKSDVELVENFLEQLDANVKSQVDYSDFKILEKDLRKDLRMVGRFNVPLSLAPISERIYDTYGDITSESSQSDCAAMPSYFLFCAAIQEMDDLKLEQVNKNKMLLWRDAINSALNVQFKVDFAKQHLKRIARAYFGLKAMEEINNEKLKNMDGTVRKIEVPEDCLHEAKYFWGKEEINNEEFKNIDGTVRKQKVLEDCLSEAKYFWGEEEINNEELKNIDGKVRKKKVLEDCLREAKYFWGKPLSTGLFY